MTWGIVSRGSKHRAHLLFWLCTFLAGSLVNQVPPPGVLKEAEGWGMGGPGVSAGDGEDLGDKLLAAPWEASPSE